jgi:RNA polymerase sigma-54 factor
MSLAPRLDLRQAQSLVMTPQLQQAIKLLALSNLEVEAFIAEELDKNPLVEAVSGGGEDGAAPPADLPPAPEEAPPVDAVDGMARGEEALDAGDPGERFADSPVDMTGVGERGGSVDAPSPDEYLAAELGLADHLRAQAGERLSGIDLLVAEQLIDAVDEAGYLRTPPLEIAERLGLADARVEAVLSVMQQFDPTGVGARDLAECLALQAREADRLDPAMATLLRHLDLLARGELGRLRRLCGVDEEDMADMIRELRGYDPKPGLRFGGSPAPPVVPDVLVRPTAAGGWVVDLNSATLPRLIVNRRYHAELSRGAVDARSRAWLAERWQSANWLAKALDQRARTIVTVATEIVRLQDGFFREGVERLRPLTLRAVADTVGLHESTVSRVTSNKYLGCTRGLFELKYFFGSGIAAADGGEGAAATAVKSHIARLIADEPADAILSDDALAALLKERGFDIARRTVAKYREALGLGSSTQRRRARLLAG